MLEPKISLRSWRVAVLLIAALAAMPASAAAPATDGAIGWINRMNVALTQRNFDGALVRKIGPKSAMLLIVHRVQDGRMSERLTVLPTDRPGPGDEFVRNGNESIAYYPQDKAVVVQERNRSYGFLRAFTGLTERSAREYVISDRGTETVEGRVVQHVSIEPRDALRYGYHFWLDPNTALPLKTQIVARSGDVLEEISFKSFSLPARIEDERLKPEIDASKFKWKNRKMPAYRAELKKKFVPRAELLPAGFRTVMFNPPAKEAAEQAKAPGPRARYLISDGVAVVSVFIELPDQKAAPKDATGAGNTAKDAGNAKGKSVSGSRDATMVMGAYTAHVTIVDGHKITVVGELPPATAKAIAGALRPE
jgi:sigma-E factor negative regulatory protein RseB